MARRCRAFKFLLQPTATQGVLLDRLLTDQRELYNAALEERRGAWKWEKRTITKFEQFSELASLRAVRPDVLTWGTTVCRGTLTRLDEAFRAFYRRVRAGEKPGYPRFKGPGRWDSVSWPYRAGWTLDEDSRRLRIHGIGTIKYRRNRPTRGSAKTIAVRREGRRWFVIVFCVDVPAQPLPSTGRRIGLDLGLNHLVTTSDGERIANPRPGARASHRIETAQRAVSRKKRGGSNRRRAASRLGSIHRRVARQRLDYLHKLSRTVVDQNDTVVHENLNVRNLTRRPAAKPDGEGGFAANGASAKAALNRAVLDAGWGIFLRLLAYKAEDAGRTVIAVSPRLTSQTCHACGHVEAANRYAAVFKCVKCGHTDDADTNAARNILRAGLAQRGQPREAEGARGHLVLSFAGP